jgi:hypothetical protein
LKRRNYLIRHWARCKKLCPTSSEGRMDWCAVPATRPKVRGLPCVHLRCMLSGWNRLSAYKYSPRGLMATSA